MSVIIVLLRFLRTLLGFIILMLLPLAWVLRDGLGPSALESHGFIAVWRALMVFKIWGLIALFASLHVIILYSVSLIKPIQTPRRQKQSATPLCNCLYITCLLLGCVMLSLFIGGILFWKNETNRSEAYEPVFAIQPDAIESSTGIISSDSESDSEKEMDPLISQ